MGLTKPLFRYQQSDKQFGKVFQQGRTTLANFFRVRDSYPDDRDVVAIAQKRNLAYFEMEWAAAQVLCAMNLLTMGNTTTARRRLRTAIRINHYFTALNRPRKFVRLYLGLVMFLTAYVGLGRVVGNIIFSAYRYDLKRKADSYPSLHGTELQ